MPPCLPLPFDWAGQEVDAVPAARPGVRVAAQQVVAALLLVATVLRAAAVLRAPMTHLTGAACCLWIFGAQ